MHCSVFTVLTLLRHAAAIHSGMLSELQQHFVNTPAIEIQSFQQFICQCFSCKIDFITLGNNANNSVFDIYLLDQ